MRKNKGITMLFMILFSLGTISSLFAHCEIPCGIYDDHMRIHMLEEHIATMEKSINQINALSDKNTAQDKNQLVRWIMNKEDHANQFQEIVWQYFLTQRIKPVDPANAAAYQEYLKKVELLHQLSFYAMKVKQNTDLQYTTKLKELLKQFEELYFKDHKKDKK
ncbi:MAG: superoxide dismutase [Ni] [Calditrichia bacterium]